MPEMRESFLENELIEGDGRALPMGGWYCAACHVAALSGIETGESPGSTHQKLSKFRLRL